MSLKKRNLADFGEDSDSDYGDSEQASILKRSKASTQSTNQTTINEQMEIDCIECMLHKIKCTDFSEVSLEKAPSKRSSQFQIEINLRNYSVNIERGHLFDKIVNDHRGVHCIVSLEENQSQKTKYRSSKQFKIFLNMKYTYKRLWDSKEIYAYIFHLLRSFVGGEQEISDDDLLLSNTTMDFDKRPEIIILKPNTSREAVTWATVDFDPRFTSLFNPETFSDSYRIEKWARENVNKTFSLDMPFIRRGGCRKSHADLKRYLDEHKNKHHIRHQIQPCELGPFGDWRDECIEWWNSWCKPDAWYPKKEQLLIVGQDSNTGKTTLITEALFRGADPANQIPREAILIPERSGSKRSVSSFAWQKARPAYHSVIFCDEFEIGYYNTETLKIVLEGSFFNPQIKMQCSGDDIQLAIPAIFISNNDIPEFDECGKDLKPLMKRFKIVHVPSNAKKYLAKDINPYVELFQEKKREELKKRSLENAFEDAWLNFGDEMQTLNSVQPIESSSQTNAFQITNIAENVESTNAHLKTVTSTDEEKEVAEVNNNQFYDPQTNVFSIPQLTNFAENVESTTAHLTEEESSNEFYEPLTNLCMIPNTKYDANLSTNTLLVGEINNQVYDKKAIAIPHTDTIVEPVENNRESTQNNFDQNTIENNSRNVYLNQSCTIETVETNEQLVNLNEVIQDKQELISCEKHLTDKEIYSQVKSKLEDMLDILCLY